MTMNDPSSPLHAMSVQQEVPLVSETPNHEPPQQQQPAAPTTMKPLKVFPNTGGPYCTTPTKPKQKTKTKKKKTKRGDEDAPIHPASSSSHKRDSLLLALATKAALTSKKRTKSKRSSSKKTRKQHNTANLHNDEESHANPTATTTTEPMTSSNSYDAAFSSLPPSPAMDETSFSCDDEDFAMPVRVFRSTLNDDDDGGTAPPETTRPSLMICDDPLLRASISNLTSFDESEEVHIYEEEEEDDDGDEEKQETTTTKPWNSSRSSSSTTITTTTTTTTTTSTATTSSRAKRRSSTTNKTRTTAGLKSCFKNHQTQPEQVTTQHRSIQFATAQDENGNSINDAVQCIFHTYQPEYDNDDDDDDGDCSCSTTQTSDDEQDSLHDVDWQSDCVTLHSNDLIEDLDDLSIFENNDKNKDQPQQTAGLDTSGSSSSSSSGSGSDDEYDEFSLCEVLQYLPDETADRCETVLATLIENQMTKPINKQVNEENLNELANLYKVEDETLRGLEDELCQDVLQKLQDRHIQNVLETQKKEYHEKTNNNNSHDESVGFHDAAWKRLRKASLKSSRPLRYFSVQIARYDTKESIKSIFSRWDVA